MDDLASLIALGQERTRVFLRRKLLHAAFLVNGPVLPECDVPAPKRSLNLVLFGHLVLRLGLLPLLTNARSAQGVGLLQILGREDLQALRNFRTAERCQT